MDQLTAQEPCAGSAERLPFLAAARTLSLGPALCARLEAARAPMYDSRALSELDALKARIEATARLMRSLADRWEAAGDAAEGARARAAADALETRMRALLSTL